MKKLVLTAIFVLIVINAFADDDSFYNKYASVNLGDLYYQESTAIGNYDATAYMLTGIAGHRFNEYFSIESRLGLGLTDGTETIVFDSNTYYIFMSLDTLIGAYGKAAYTFDNGFQIYGLAGYTKIDGSVKVGTIEESFSESGVSIGYGFDYCFRDDLSFGLEFMSYLYKSDYDISAFKIGITKSF